jgi:spore coat-associated protein N
MQRAAVLWRASPARLLLALFALLLAGGMAAATGANFNSTSNNPANAVTAGIISHTNSKNNAAVLSVTKLMPGTPQSGTVTITNTGDAAQGSSVTFANLADTPTTPGSKLSDALEVRVREDGNQIWSGTLAQLPTLPLGAWAVGEAHTYAFQVELPDTGPNGADNEYQGAGASVDLKWELTS